MWLKIRFLLFTLFICFLQTWSYDMSLPPSRENYKILFLHPFCSPSHQIPFLAVAKAMAERGHQITFMSAIPSSYKHENITEINHIVSHVVEGGPSFFDENEKDPTGYVLSFKDNLPNLARDLYDNMDVMDLYNRRHEFDLIITDDLFNEPGYPFLVGKRYVVLSPFGITPQSSSKMGNVLNPSFQPSILTDYPRPYSFLQRVKNTWAHFLPAFLWNHVYVVPAVEAELRKKFPNLPPIAEIEKGMGLVLANLHFSLDFSMPLLPSQIQVGGLHCRPGKQLSQELNDFIEGSGSRGTIYFSLGSVVQDKTLLTKYKNMLIQSFSQLQQRVIWKFDSKLDDLPNNVMIRNWLPQQDILAHPNIKLFITHGGSLSLQESIYNEKPLLALPVFGDQMRNGQRIQNMGIGKFLLWEELTVKLFVSTINELLMDDAYKTVVKRISSNFQDQQLSPLDNAICWIEYFIRNKGAPQLQSPAADLSWIEYLMIDILILAHLLLFFIYWVLKRIIVILVRVLFVSNAYQNKKKIE